jgi:hypothetical protein
MNKKLLVFLPVFLLLVSSTEVHASSLFVVTKEGTVEKRVLGDSVDVNATVQKVTQKVASAAIDGVKEIALAEIESKTHIKIITNSNDSSLDVPSVLSQLVEIEEGNPSDKVVVTKLDEGFGITQKGITAKTLFNVTIHPEDHRVSVKTSRGESELVVMPSEAVKSVVASGAINILPKDGAITVESNGIDVLYLIKGERVVNVFNKALVTVPVTVMVSTISGEVSHIDQPQWLSLFGFLFT